MYRAEDAVAGKGQNRRKPHTSVLPYLRSKEEDRDNGGNKPTASKVERVEKTDSYSEARRSIVSGE